MQHRQKLHTLSHFISLPRATIIQLKILILGYGLLIKRAIRLVKHARKRHFSNSYKPVSRDAHHWPAGEKVIIAMSTTGNTQIASLDLEIARLHVRFGARCLVYACSGDLSACTMCELEAAQAIGLNLNGLKAIQCIGCRTLAKTLKPILESQDLRIALWPQLSSEKQKEAEKFCAEFLESGKLYPYKNCSVHEHALSGMIRYLGRPIKLADILRHPDQLSIYADFLRASCFTCETWLTILATHQPSLVILNHGLYVPQGVIADVCRTHSVACSIWHFGYRKSTLVISHGDTYHKTLVEKNIDDILSVPLNEAECTAIEQYLQSRRYGSNDQISFVHAGAEEQPLPDQALDNSNRTRILVLTNVAWDAQCHYQNNVYTSMTDWIDDILQLATTRPNCQFIFRCHPAEVTGRRVSTVLTSDYIRSKSIGRSNIVVIDSFDPVSTYKLIEVCHAVIVYATKTAVEAACMGKPVLVCGESCLKGKAIGLDLTTPRELSSCFDHLISRFKCDTIRAKRYAYHLFFREMVEWSILNTRPSVSVVNDRHVVARFRS